MLVTKVGSSGMLLIWADVLSQRPFHGHFIASDTGFFRASKESSRIWPALLDGLRDIWPTLTLIPIYLGIVHFGDYSNKVVRPDFATLTRFIWIGWNKGFLTATLGLHYGLGGLIAANVLVLALMLWSIVRRPTNLVLWFGFVLYFVVSIGVVGWNRAIPFGIASAEIARYYADIMCLFLAVLVIAFGRTYSDRSIIHRPSLIVVVLATTLGSIHLLNAGENVPHLWYAGPERPAVFVSNVKAALAARGKTQAIADGTLPDYIMPNWVLRPLNRYRLFVRLLGWQGKVVDDRIEAPSFDQDGNLTSR